MQVIFTLLWVVGFIGETQIWVDTNLNYMTFKGQYVTVFFHNISMLDRTNLADSDFYFRP